MKKSDTIRLTRLQQRSVEDHILENKVGISEGKISKSAVRDYMAKKLGMPIKFTHIESSAKAVSVEFVRSKRSRTKTERSGRYDVLCGVIQSLAKELIEVKSGLGMTSSGELHKIAGRGVDFIDAVYREQQRAEAGAMMDSQSK